MKYVSILINWSPRVQEVIHESCREAEAKPAPTEPVKKGEDEEEFILMLAEHDEFLDDVDPTESQENNPREPDSTEDYQNNNKQLIAKKIDPAQAAAEEAENPGQADLDDSSTELDNRRTEFFPEPQSQNARTANRDEPKRQLNVHGLTPEFLEAMAGGIMEKELMSLHG